MNTHIKLIFGAALVVPVLAIATATAVVDETRTSRANPNNSEEVRLTQAEDGDEGTSSEEKIRSREERFEARKEKFQLRLTFAEEQRLKTRCKSSQGKLRSLEGRINGIETSRTQVYGNLLERLSGLAERLEVQGYDVSTLTEQLTDLQVKIDTFNVQLDTYKVAVSDLAEMDCENDPEAFKVSLEDARQAHDDLKVSSNDVRAYLKETIKSTLQEIRSQLGDDEAQPVEENGTQDTTEEEGN
jgi:hypothetical protein